MGRIQDYWEDNHETIFLVFLLVCLSAAAVTSAVAVPTTEAATDVGSNNATLSATGAAGAEGYFTWGQNSGNHYWISPNATISGGAFNITISQSPLFGGTVFYFAACDQSGCGNEQSFTTLPVTPMPQTNLGTFYKNITQSGFNVPNMAAHLIDPYIWNGSPVTVIFMLVFSPVFIGVWLRSRTVLVALILGFITGSFILYGNQGLNLGLPPEVVSIAQAICYVAFAGMIVYILKR